MEISDNLCYIKPQESKDSIKILENKWRRKLRDSKILLDFYSRQSSYCLKLMDIPEEIWSGLIHYVLVIYYSRQSLILSLQHKFQDDVFDLPFFIYLNK
jgi:hypothetical protein